MTVQQRDIGQADATIVTARALARQQPLFERIVAGVLMALSFGGTALWGGGGWGAWATLNPSWVGLLLGLTAQAVLSYSQYIYCERVLQWRYLVPLILSSALTIAGYLPLVYDSLSGWVSVWGGPAITPALTVIIVTVPAVWLDMVPERIFVRR